MKCLNQKGLNEYGNVTFDQWWCVIFVRINFSRRKINGYEIRPGKNGNEIYFLNGECFCFNYLLTIYDHSKVFTASLIGNVAAIGTFGIVAR